VDWRISITTDPEVAHGQTCIVGTRLPASVVLNTLAPGNSAAEVLKSYPSLRREAFKAAIAHPAQSNKERILSISG